MGMPGTDQQYAGARSLYQAIFQDTADFGLRTRFTNLELHFGYPHILTMEGLRAINDFAMGELTAMIIHGTAGSNTSLPLTDTQKQRAKQQQEQEKKRAAAARWGCRG